MKSELVDVTVVVASVKKDDSGRPYAVSKIVRMDVEVSSTRPLSHFLEALRNLPGVVESSEV